MSTESPSAAALAAMLDRWVETDLISDEQADRIRTAEAAASPAPGNGRGTSMVAEAMGYLGGVIVLVGLGLGTGWFWEDLTTAARVGLAGAVAVLFVVAGAAVPSRIGDTGTRLRSVLWVGAVAAVFAALALLAADALRWHDNEMLVLAGGGATLVAVPLWALHRRVLQEAAALVPLLVAAAAGTTVAVDDDLAPMAVVWGIGVVWVLLAWADLLRPRQAGLVLGAVATIIASLTIESEDWGTALALITVVALVTLAVAIRDLPLLAVAAVGTLAVLPTIVVRYFPGVLSAALTLMLVGLLLVVAAVYTARRRPPRTRALTHKLG